MVLSPAIAANFPPQTSELEAQGLQNKQEIIETGHLRGQRGGIGWSILMGIGVRSPEAEKFKIHDCMRENEILESWDLLQQGIPVLWEGGDGYGKTTFLGEFSTFVDSLNVGLRPTEQYTKINLSHLEFRSVESINNTLSRLQHIVKQGPERTSQVIFLLDSADYLWEKLPNDQNYAVLASKKVSLMEAILKSGCKVFMNAHKEDSKNKSVDELTKIRCKALFKTHNVDIQDLPPIYPEEKMKKVLTRLGFPREVMSSFFSSIFFPIRRHGTMVNYVLGNNPGYELSNLLSWMDTFNQYNSGTTELGETVKSVIAARDKVRIRDWIANGY